MEPIRVGEYEIDEASLEIRVRGRPVVVEPLVFRLIACLARERPNVVSKEKLIDELWGGRAVSDSALSRAVSLARAALRTDAEENPIVSVYGTGYRLAVDGGSPARDPTRPRRSRRAAESVVAERPIVSPSPSFVGRKRELADLTSAVESARAGEGALHFVSGEAGIGKTRLAERLIELASDGGVVARIGRCAESDGAPSFWPWVQIVREELEANGREQLAELGATPARRIERMVSPDPEPETRPGTEPHYSANERFALFDAVTRLLLRAAQRAPTLVVIDDVHRADRSSLALLQFLVQELATSPLLLVGTYRELDLGQRPYERAALAEIARTGRAVHHALGGLEAVDVPAFLPGRDVSVELARLLHEKTGGNPLFLSHLAAWVAATPDGSRLDTIAARLPPALRDAIGLQLGGLTEPCRDALKVASVVGRDFDVELLRQLADLSANDALELVAEAVAARVLVAREDPAEGYRFCHLLVRDHLYESLTPADRAERHLRVARVLESRRVDARPSHVAAIAHHFRSATPFGPADPAIDYSLRAGALAQERAAYEEAAWQYEQALSLLGADDPATSLRRAEILLDLSGARARAGDSDGARTACRTAASLARDLERPDILARAAFALSPGFFAIETALYDQELVALLEEALAANESADPDTRIRLESRLATALYWSDQVDRRARLSDSALAKAEALGESPALAWALNACHSATWGPDTLEDRIGLSTRAVQISERTSNAEDTLVHRAVLITDLFERGMMRQLDIQLQEFGRVATVLAQPQSMWLPPMLGATRALMEGEFSVARALSNESVEIGRRAKSEDAENCWAAQTCLARFEMGEGEVILPVLRAHIRSHPRLLPFRAAPGWVSAELGLTEEASHDLGEFADDAFTSIPRDMNWLGMMTMLAMVCAELREVEWSRELIRLLSPYRDRYALLGYGAIFLGSVAGQIARLASIVDDWTSAESLFARSRHMNFRVRAMAWIARSEHDHGRELLARGRNRDAERLLDASAARATRLRMSHLESRVQRTRALLGSK